jgi:hypothetical protein
LPRSWPSPSPPPPPWLLLQIIPLLLRQRLHLDCYSYHVTRYEKHIIMNFILQSTLTTTLSGQEYTDLGLLQEHLSHFYYCLYTGWQIKILAFFLRHKVADVVVIILYLTLLLHSLNLPPSFFTILLMPFIHFSV